MFLTLAPKLYGYNASDAFCDLDVCLYRSMP